MENIEVIANSVGIIIIGVGTVISNILNKRKNKSIETEKIAFRTEIMMLIMMNVDIKTIEIRLNEYKEKGYNGYIHELYEQYKQTQKEEK